MSSNDAKGKCEPTRSSKIFGAYGKIYLTQCSLQLNPTHNEFINFGYRTISKLLTEISLVTSNNEENYAYFSKCMLTVSFILCLQKHPCPLQNMKMFLWEIFEYELFRKQWTKISGSKTFEKMLQMTVVWKHIGPKNIVPYGPIFSEEYVISHNPNGLCEPTYSSKNIGLYGTKK